jgi:hypothetical protein
VTFLTSEIAIAAPSTVVWDVLVDFDSYADWNPVEIKARGVPVVGSILEHTAQLPGRRPMTFRAKVIEATPGRALAWRGRIIVPGLFDVVHQFEIDPLAADHSRLRQSEHFSGLLVPFMRGMLRDTQAAFALANDAIRRRAEDMVAAAPHPEPGLRAARVRPSHRLRAWRG